MPRSPVATTVMQRNAPITANSIAAAPLSDLENFFHFMTLLHQARHGRADRPRAGAAAIDLEQRVAHKGDRIGDHLGAIGVGIVAARILQGPVGYIDRAADNLTIAAIEFEGGAGGHAAVAEYGNAG